MTMISLLFGVNFHSFRDLAKYTPPKSQQQRESRPKFYEGRFCCIGSHYEESSLCILRHVDIFVVEICTMWKQKCSPFTVSPETQPTEKRKDFIGNFCKDSPSNM